MNDAKYIGLDVQQAAISAVILDSTGKRVMESILRCAAKPQTANTLFESLRNGSFQSVVIEDCIGREHGVMLGDESSEDSRMRMQELVKRSIHVYAMREYFSHSVIRWQMRFWA